MIKKFIQKIKFILIISGRICRNLFVLSRIEYRKNKKFRIGTWTLAAAILVLIVWQIPNWYKTFSFRTRFHSTQWGIDGVSEKKAQKDLGNDCEALRKDAKRLYGENEIEKAVKESKDKEINLVGKETGAAAKPPQKEGAILVDTSGKKVKLACFDFGKRLIIQGSGEAEISYSRFQNIFGSALSLISGSGKIHHNIIEKSDKSGISAEKGEWEIYGNIIKNNLSYGVYGGYEANLDIHDNYISGNGGYQVRLQRERSVYR